uniref:Putative glycosyltransferase At5g03795 n=1 Tax=Rhizophora mucronata TaxID=61149 RepID=A0A2P2K289_RHIMU
MEITGEFGISGIFFTSGTVILEDILCAGLRFPGGSPVPSLLEKLDTFSFTADVLGSFGTSRAVIFGSMFLGNVVSGDKFTGANAGGMDGVSAFLASVFSGKKLCSVFSGADLLPELLTASLVEFMPRSTDRSREASLSWLSSPEDLFVPATPSDRWSILLSAALYFPSSLAILSEPLG